MLQLFISIIYNYIFCFDYAKIRTFPNMAKKIIIIYNHITFPLYNTFMFIL